MLLTWWKQFYGPKHLQKVKSSIPDVSSNRKALNGGQGPRTKAKAFQKA